MRKKKLLKRISIIVVLFLLNASISYSQDMSPADTLRSWVAKHPYVSVLLKEGSLIQGQLKTAGETSCLVQEYKSEEEIDYTEISEVKRIRGPDETLAWTIAIGLATLFLAAVVYSKQLK